MAGAREEEEAAGVAVKSVGKTAEQVSRCWARAAALPGDSRRGRWGSEEEEA